MKDAFRLLILVSAATLLGGCASIMGQPTQTIPIQSTPAEAKVLIFDEAGKEVFTGTTPTMATLQKSTGKYFGAKSFTVRLTKDGFAEQVIALKASPNAWYLAGNFVLGGPIGWLIVDPMSGHMYTLSPEAVHSQLGTRAAHNNTANDGSISIVLLQNVPDHLRAEMKPVR